MDERERERAPEASDVPSREIAMIRMDKGRIERKREWWSDARGEEEKTDLLRGVHS